MKNFVLKYGQHRRITPAADIGEIDSGVIESFVYDCEKANYSDFYVDAYAGDAPEKWTVYIKYAGQNPISSNAFFTKMAQIRIREASFEDVVAIV